MFHIFQNYIYFLSSVDFKKAISFAYDTSNYLTFLPNLENQNRTLSSQTKLPYLIQSSQVPKQSIRF